MVMLRIQKVKVNRMRVGLKSHWSKIKVKVEEIVRKAEVVEDGIMKYKK